MCGLIAAVTESADMMPAIDRAVRTMQRRGPDGEGVWHGDGVYLGHRRLAVLDLDARAAQPMHSSCGRYVCVFNGEIYNFRDLRRELECQGTHFQTTSDTEVVLALFATQGEAMLPRLHGMFAFVIWDRLARRAFAARDPYGIKPLYYARCREGVILASQVKALLATGLISQEPDLRGQAGFWLLGSVPEPDTWYRDVRALPAGQCMSISSEGAPDIRCWQDIGDVWRGAPAVLPSAEETVRCVRDALRESVARHLVADVPVGVFLSGGIDSGALAGLMRDVGSDALQGVTLSYAEFEGRAQDEAPIAARVAAHYGIRHHVRQVTREEFVRDLPRIMAAMDQPSIDGINTWYASKAVAELGLKVVVSGAGGDELFQGYDTFRRLPRLVSTWSRLSRIPGIPSAARWIVGMQSRRSGKPRWKYLPEWANSIAGAWWLRRGLFSPEELPALMGPEEAAEALRDFSPDAWIGDRVGTLASNPRLALGQLESTMYLRNQLLRDSDWASMDHGVELRTPLVDAWLLMQLQPVLCAFERFPNKVLLARAPHKPLPRDVCERPKTGFGIPVDRWLATDRPGVDSAVDSRHWSRRLIPAYERGAAP